LQGQLGNRAGVANVLGSLSDVHGGLGSYAEALKYSHRALTLCKEIGARAGVATNLARIGVVHLELGSYAEALRYQERALKLAEELGRRPNVASALTAIGLTHFGLGSYAEALKYQERALRLAEELEERAGVATALGNVGAVHIGLESYAEALKYQERALQLKQELGDRKGVAQTLGNIGVIHYYLESYAEALEHYERALKLCEELGYRTGIAITLGNIGNVHRNLGSHAKALEYQERARALAAELGLLQIEITNLLGLASVHLKRGEAQQAARRGREAVQKVDLLARGLAEEQGASARGQWTRLVETGALSGVALQDAAEVSFFLESGRAVTLLEGLGGRERLQAAVIPDELRAQQTTARERERVALWHYRKALDAGEEVEDLWAEVEAARGAIVAAHRRIQREAKAQADVLYPEAAPLAEIQATQRGNEALVLLGLFEKESLALLVTAGEVRIVPLGETEKIGKAAEAVQRAVARPDERGVAAPPHESLPYLTKRLRKLVIEPLGLGDECKRLLVSPDGPLSYVPFALLTKREVAYVPSGTTYKLLRGERHRRGAQVLALGHPDYSVAPDEKALMVMRGGKGLSPLPATKEEVQKIGDELLIGKRATVDGFREAVRKQERWQAVHLACHGRIDPERPALSSLAFTGGFLKCLDVYRMKIPADLVVLSACETAKGKIYKAEGVIGFTRAFLFAGAPRVIVSLWKVDDEATRALMVKFYELWKPGKMATATALKEAQAYVASHEKWKHPYFWAAWQLWGLPN
jgi:CHAT domain-containing protein